MPNPSFNSPNKTVLLDQLSQFLKAASCKSAFVTQSNAGVTRECFLGIWALANWLWAEVMYTHSRFVP